MLLSHDSLLNFVKTNFSLVQFHKYSQTELENFMPWERTAYIDMLTDHINLEKQKARDLRNAQKDNASIVGRHGR